MRKIIIFCCALMAVACQRISSDQTMPLLHVEGESVVSEYGDTVYIQGVNLGNWLNPEGYFFLLDGSCNSPRKINDLICEMVGPEEADAFWEAYKDNYITEEDIRFIATTGANTVRLPFHYALLTDDDYMGCKSREGFARLDSAIAWCRRAGLYVVLDMHDCPAGQTGDNIDDSYGYPFLYTSPKAQTLFCQLWREIAEHYRDENTVLGYELMNEPIAHYFTKDTDTMNAYLEPLYARCVDSIRTVDTRHIILLGGAQWNGNFRIFTGQIDDANILYACHRYGHAADEEGIQDFIRFRDSLHVAMCMTETGHRPHEWLIEEAATLRRNRIGLLWWPYKKLEGSCWMSASAPADWQLVRDFSAADRRSFASVRAARPDAARIRQCLSDYLDSVRYEHCHPDTVYTQIFLR